MIIHCVVWYQEDSLSDSKCVHHTNGWSVTYTGSYHMVFDLVEWLVIYLCSNHDVLYAQCRGFGVNLCAMEFHEML